MLSDKDLQLIDELHAFLDIHPDLRADHLRIRLKRAGLIEFVGKRWRLTADGKALYHHPLSPPFETSMFVEDDLTIPPDIKRNRRRHAALNDFSGYAPPKPR